MSVSERYGEYGGKYPEAGQIVHDVLLIAEVDEAKRMADGQISLDREQKNRHDGHVRGEFGDEAFEVAYR